MHLPDIITALNLHPDSRLPQSEPDAFRARGFMGLRVTPCGRIRVEYHWGTRTFESQDELENWLAGIVPASWQQ
jgi:hypothetical protein